MWTELWRKASLKHTLAPERPQVVETFIQELMEGAEESGGQVSKKNPGYGPSVQSLKGHEMEQKICLHVF